MDRISKRIKRRWHRYHYKNLTYLAMGVIVGLMLLTNQTFRDVLLHVGTLGYFGAFVAGILFVSTFTMSIGTVLLLFLAENLHPLELAVIAGIGAVMGDLMIFRFVRSRGLATEIRHIFEFLGSDKINHLVHTKYFSWTLPVIGALVIASPLPDELGVSLMGISKMGMGQFIAVSFVFNAIGILLVVFTGAVFKP